MCTNKIGHRDSFSVPHVLRGLTEPQAKREMKSVLCHTLVIDLMFKQSENVTIVHNGFIDIRGGRRD